MGKIIASQIIVPIDVPPDAREDYINNFLKLTKETGKLMLFAGDQKIEHLNDDFFGKDISDDDSDPEHLFRIADQANIGVFAAQLGLINRYAMSYPNVPYLVKLNSKTHLVKDKDPISCALASVEQVVEIKKNYNLNIYGVGYTIYLGSEFESEMLAEVAQIINHAHYNGLIVVLWIYPRGKSVLHEKDPHLIAGACGVAASLGADFVKVNYPSEQGINSAEAFKEATKAAGRTQVVCAGGSSTDVREFLQRLHDQIHISGARGNATGRNIHQKPLAKAIRMCNAISAITFEDNSVDEAMGIYES